MATSSLTIGRRLSRRQERTSLPPRRHELVTVAGRHHYAPVSCRGGGIDVCWFGDLDRPAGDEHTEDEAYQGEHQHHREGDGEGLPGGQLDGHHDRADQG